MPHNYRRINSTIGNNCFLCWLYPGVLLIRLGAKLEHGMQSSKYFLRRRRTRIVLRSFAAKCGWVFLTGRPVGRSAVWLCLHWTVSHSRPSLHTSPTQPTLVSHFSYSLQSCTYSTCREILTCDPFQHPRDLMWVQYRKVGRRRKRCRIL